MNSDEVVRETTREIPRAVAPSGTCAPGAVSRTAAAPPTGGDAASTRGAATERSRRAAAWEWTARLAALAGVGCAAGFLWGIDARLTYWEIRPFVLLIYGTALFTFVASAAARRAKRLDVSGFDATAGVRRLLWIAVAAVLVWVWFPPADHILGWGLRQMSAFRFGP